MRKGIIGLCAGLIVAGCVVPGAVWLADRQDQALLNHVNQVLTREDVTATVTMRGRVATIARVDPQHAQTAAAIIGAVPGVARVETVPTAQQNAPTPSTESGPPTSQGTSTSTSPSLSPEPPVEPEPSIEPIPSLEPIFFDGGSTELRASAGPRIDELATILTNRPELVVHLIGHTDNGLTLQERDAIGLARAQTVAEELVARGVEAGRISVDNRGDREPLGDNRTPEGLELNRRVQIVLEVVGR